MAWTGTEGSKVFQAWVDQMYQVSGTGYTGVDSDTVKAALFGNTGTPDRTVAVALTGFNTGQWVVANEITDATNWVSGGRVLSGKTFTFPAGGTYMFDASDLAGGGNMTVAGVYGVFLYDDSITAGTVADQGMSFHYLGGPNGVSGGTFTVVWNALGLHRATI
jgi:hypothetical protein